MKAGRAIPAILAAALLLSGCTPLLNRTYSTKEQHSNQFWESESTDTLRAENYQDVVNDVLLLIDRHTEDATVRFYSEADGPAVTDLLERAAGEVQQETAMGAYAVEYITFSPQAQKSYYEVTLHIQYRRTAEQVQAVVNATSTSALPDLLDAALMAGKTELAVRIGYWGENDAAAVEQILSDVRQGWFRSEDAPWQVFCYPSMEHVGLLEFDMSGIAPESAEDASASRPDTQDGEDAASPQAAGGDGESAGTAPQETPAQETVPEAPPSGPAIEWRSRDF